MAAKERQDSLKNMNTDSQNQSMKIKGRMSGMPGSGLMNVMRQSNDIGMQSNQVGPTKTMIQHQQNYMRGYSPSKPLWK